MPESDPAAATFPILATKLFAPPPRTEQVPRPRLLQLLDQGLAARLILVSAPAGFGKTTLLSEWVSSLPDEREEGTPRPALPGAGSPASLPPRSPASVAWLSLDAADNDPARFLRYLVAALQAAAPGIGETALDLLRAPQPPPVEALLTVLLNDMVALATPLLLALDDYQLIENRAIHEALAYFVDHLPPTGHVVLSTRADPPLPLARWRSRGQLLEVRADDLRFTAEEAALFLNERMELNLAAPEIAALEERTEGWITGLQVAALSLRGRPDAAAFIQSFSGSHRYVLDYLIEEVLEHQPEEVLTFLLRTSILERLCGPLCDAVTGRSDGQAMLEHLERGNLFLVPLDEERRWYRYHHLFAELLRARRQQAVAGPEQASGYHHAADWCASHGLAAEAVDYALTARDLHRAVPWIEQVALPLLTLGEMATLQRWVAAIPRDLILSRPQLCVTVAWIRAFSPDWEDADSLLDAAEEHVARAEPTPETRALLGAIATLRAGAANVRGDITGAIAWDHRALELLPAEAYGPRGVALSTLGRSYLYRGEIARAEQVLTEYVLTGDKLANVWTSIYTRCELAWLRQIQGRLSQALELYQMAVELAGLPVEAIVPVAVGLSEVLSQRNELATARQYLEGSVGAMQLTRHLHWWENANIVAAGSVTLTRVLLAQGDAEGAHRSLLRAEVLVPDFGIYPEVQAQIAANRVRVWLARGNLAAAGRWAAEAPASPGEALDPTRELLDIAVARVLLAQGELEPAAQQLARLAAAAQGAGRCGRLIEILVLQSLARHARGRTTEALSALGNALSLGEPEGYIRVFLDEGAPLAELLQLGERRGAWDEPDLAAYVRRLRAAFSAAKPGSVAPVAPSGPGAPTAGLVEPLSERELEVLRLLVAGRSNQQIAEELILALGTVKTHVHNIYGKLGAVNRAQAVTRAGELGLL